MESVYVSNTGQACAGSASSKSVQYSGSTTNNSPTIKCGDGSIHSGKEFTSYLSASDPDNDSLKDWSISPSSDPSGSDPSSWSTWKDSYSWQWSGGATGLAASTTAVTNQRRIHAAKAGAEGTYKFKASVADSRGGTAEKTCSISVTNSAP
ncbi:hypothetical protein HY798_01445, partial [Candidatus Falkowbacteria bacterium]|nr:hypothetical protein [Candidatus Falkowbacteria bacterium]